ncbi:hypothetical protein NST99_33290 [Paenibacillus sp. FSL L8-0470]|uniref:hypothetical protein n=1 Tax=Paenibacillus sp. FSL L8-0470 TaxID=2954688 RepID=UPI0030F75AAB
MSKGKPADLKRHFIHAAKQKSAEAPVIFQLSKHTFRLCHSTYGQGVAFLASQEFPSLFLVTQPF